MQSLSFSREIRDRLIRFLPPEILGDFPQTKGLFPNTLKTHLERLYPGRSSEIIIKLTKALLISFIQTSLDDTPNFNILEQLNLLKIELDSSAITKIGASTTTKRYLESIRKIYQIIEPSINKEIFFQTSFDLGPNTVDIDFLNERIIFQIETTIKIKDQWLDYLVRLFISSYENSHTHVCLILPLQEEIYPYELSNWKTRKEFFEVLLSPDIIETNIETEICCEYGIGSHRDKGSTKSLPEFVIMLSPDLPWQIFIGNSKSFSVSFTEAEIHKTREIIFRNKLQLYIHSPFVINLCRPYNDPEMLKSSSSEEGCHISILRKNLFYGRLMGFRGVVVHTGNYLKMSETIAVENMRQNILRLLSEASEECPLLLETTAGKGTDTCWRLEDFTNFMETIPDPRFGVVIDTCHVADAGYDPVDFLEANIERTKLVHYNDSRHPKGSHRDVHANIGTGFVPLDSLIMVAKICSEKKIPMVRE
jgi:deoxyribonuclease-4